MFSCVYSLRHDRNKHKAGWVGKQKGFEGSWGRENIMIKTLKKRRTKQSMCETDIMKSIILYPNCKPNHNKNTNQ